MPNMDNELKFTLLTKNQTKFYTDHQTKYIHIPIRFYVYRPTFY